MVDVYIEGGGDESLLRSKCRKGFRLLLEKCGFAGRMPKLHACGGRAAAFDDFCTALGMGKNALLLLDSETKVLPAAEKGESSSEWNPWVHLFERDGKKWKKPEGAGTLDCHLMVQCMETWLLADTEAIKTFYGENFSEKSLPRTKNIESIDKATVYACFAKASKDCKKGEYSKGGHAFDILETINPELIRYASRWAARFFAELDDRLSSKQWE